MQKALRTLAGLGAVLLIAAAIAWAGSRGSVSAFGHPLFALCGAFAFGVNWIVFIPAYVFQTERYFDLTGSLTYLGLVVAALALGSDLDGRALLIAALVSIWALRLGTFLFLRIQAEGSDSRFDRIKPDFMRFFMTWTLQGLWVFLTFSCGLAAMTALGRVPLGWPAALGTALWLIGFGLEVVADRQKSAFRRDHRNEGRFITTGLWAWSRHPNYFGEILLWTGIALLALPALRGWQHATLISPIFVYVLLTRISGVPMLEARSDKRWGDDPRYRAYKAATPVLVPRPPSSRTA